MGTYGYISATALFCYCFMLLTFLAAKKNKLVNSFLTMLVGLMLWTGGSVFMRSLRWPGYVFWFHVSLLGILLLPYAYYLYINALGGIRTRAFGRLYLAAMLGCFAVNVPTGIFLKYPALIEANGKRYFIYSMDLKVSVFFILAAGLILHMFLNAFRACRSNPGIRRQYEPLILCVIVLFAGNLLIGLPLFNGFPVDIVGGLLNAFILMYALIRRRLFRLQMLASASLCYGIGILLTCALFFNLSPYLQEALQKYIPTASTSYPLFFAVIFLMAYLGFTFLWKVLTNNIFIKEELHRTEKLKEFSSMVSKSLHLQQILQETIQVIRDTMSVDSIYICMQKSPGGPFKSLYSDRPLSDLSLSLEEDNPLILCLQKSEEPLIYREFRCSVEYKSMWESEKYQLEKMGVQCCVSLKDDGQLTGVILIADRGGKKHIGYSDLQMLSSISSVASIAIKNARLYEQAYLEARTDEMTGLLNRKYFYEILHQEFEKSKETSLALAILNVDDFKLYNQLYGVKEGDRCLKRIADIIRCSVGENGYTARYSAKEFALLLPDYDIFSARKLVESIAGQIYQMNSQDENLKLKAVTVSAGISAAPYAARTVKELTDNVDLAVNHVKRSGKNGIRIFDTMIQSEKNRSHQTDHANIYKEYESTIYALTAAIDAKDHYTFSHSNNVAYYATELAAYLGLDEDVIEIVRQAALLHDIGKIRIPEDILNKEGRLNAEEYEVIKGHVEASIGIIRHLPSLDYVIPAVIGHHERYDGKGYPRRIAGEDIPATARILCIADSFDAITSKRCYKKAYPLENAKKILLDNAGTQFDPHMAAAFVKCLDTGRIRLVQSEYSGT